MKGMLRFWPFVGLLGAGLMVAVSSLVAQDRVEPRMDRQLGVMVRDLDEGAAAAGKAGGVRVDRVDDGSPADKAGIKAGDVVVEYDGERVRGARQFIRLVRETPEGRPVTMALVRDGARQSVTATPEARSFSWDMDIDEGRIQREVERSLRSLDGVQLHVNPPEIDFHMDSEPRGMPRVSGRGRLGITVESLSDQLAAYFGASDRGALVSSVTAGSPAEKAGLKAGDVITAVNGEPVRDADDAVTALAHSGTDATIGILRDKKASSLTVKREVAK